MAVITAKLGTHQQYYRNPRSALLVWWTTFLDLLPVGVFQMSSSNRERISTTLFTVCISLPLIFFYQLVTLDPINQPIQRRVRKATHIRPVVSKEKKMGFIRCYVLSRWGWVYVCSTASWLPLSSARSFSFPLWKALWRSESRAKCLSLSWKREKEKEAGAEAEAERERERQPIDASPKILKFKGIQWNHIFQYNMHP